MHACKVIEGKIVIDPPRFGIVRWEEDAPEYESFACMHRQVKEQAEESFRSQTTPRMGADHPMRQDYRQRQTAPERQMERSSSNIELDAEEGSSEESS